MYDLGNHYKDSILPKVVEFVVVFGEGRTRLVMNILFWFKKGETRQPDGDLVINPRRRNIGYQKHWHWGMRDGVGWRYVLRVRLFFDRFGVGWNPY
jgi:hypothetical protein